MAENNNDFSSRALSRISMPRTVSVDDHRTLQRLLASQPSTLHPPQVIVTPTPPSPTSPCARRSRLTLSQSHSLHSFTDVPVSAMQRTAPVTHRRPSPTTYSGAYKRVTACRRAPTENFAENCASNNILMNNSKSQQSNSCAPQINVRLEESELRDLEAVSARDCAAICEDTLGLVDDIGVGKSQQAEEKETEMAAGCLRRFEDSANARASDNNFAATGHTFAAATAAQHELKLHEKQAAVSRALSSARAASPAMHMRFGSQAQVQQQQHTGVAAHNTQTQCVDEKALVASLSHANSKANAEYIKSSGTLSSSSSIQPQPLLQQHTSSQPSNSNQCHCLSAYNANHSSKPVTIPNRLPVGSVGLHSRLRPTQPQGNHQQPQANLQAQQRSGAISQNHTSPQCLPRQNSQHNHTISGAGAGSGTNAKVQPVSPQTRSGYHQYCLEPSSAAAYSSFGLDLLGARSQPTRRGFDIPPGKSKGVQLLFLVLQNLWLLF